MFQSGWLRVARLRGADLRLHWTLPLMAVVLGGRHFSAGFFLGFVLLVLIHELGHAAMVWRYGYAVRSIDVHGLGGWCRWAGRPTQMERSAVAWGGVLAQGALYAVTWGLLQVFGRPPWGPAVELAYVFTETNVWLIALNLIPIPPLDGAEAWLLPQRWLERYRGYARRQIAIAQALTEDDPDRTDRVPLEDFADEAPIPAAELPPPDPSFDLEDDEIPDTVRAEVDAILGELLAGEEKE
ncbi:MAG: hypothetical protein H6739_35310 [Alphaproteobacteria bacterium]|nr:hypothetical protein [Alphaproteobacteria bacterium]